MRTSGAPPAVDAMHTNTYLVVANLGSTANPNMPASPTANTSLGALRSWAVPDTTCSRRPRRSVTSIEPFGRNPMSHGWSSPETTAVALTVGSAHADAPTIAIAVTSTITTSRRTATSCAHGVSAVGAPHLVTKYRK